MAALRAVLRTDAALPRGHAVSYVERLATRSFAWSVVVLTLAGGAVRFAFLGQSYWYDEAVTVRLVRSSLYSMLHAIPGSESTPPLYYVLAWVWCRMFGTSEVALRSLSALVGTAAIPVVALAGREFLSKGAGLLSAALVAASAFLVWYSQEARAYSLYVLLAALSLLLWIRAWKSPTSARLWWWAVASALALWTEYFSFFLVLPEALLLALDRKRRASARRPLIALVAAGLVLVPLIYRQAHNGQNGWIAQIPLRSRLKEALGDLLGSPPYGSPPHLWWVTGAFLALLVATIGFVASRTERRTALLLIGFACAAAFLPLVLVAVGRDYWLSRNVIAAWLPLAVATAAGLAPRSLRRWYLRMALVAVSLAIVALLSDRAYTTVTNPHKRSDWRGLARCLGRPDTARALAISPQYNSVVLELYRPSIRPAHRGDLVSEVDVVSHGASFRLPASFRRVGEACSNTIPVTRFHAPNKVPAPAARPGWSVVTDG